MKGCLASPANHLPLPPMNRGFPHHFSDEARTTRLSIPSRFTLHASRFTLLTFPLSSSISSRLEGVDIDGNGFKRFHRHDFKSYPRHALLITTAHLFNIISLPLYIPADLLTDI
jgi:hypothetical protein